MSLSILLTIFYNSPSQGFLGIREEYLVTPNSVALSLLRFFL
jgi:hypothetical protein